MRVNTHATRVASSDTLKNHAKYIVRFRLGRSKTVQRNVKLHKPSALRPGSTGGAAADVR